jgi:hypothetical protein
MQRVPGFLTIYSLLKEKKLKLFKAKNTQGEILLRCTVTESNENLNRMRKKTEKMND